MDGMEKTRRKLKGESMTMSVKTSVDWRGRPCKANKHGGMTAAIFVLSLQAFEMMAIAAVGNNLITYVFNDMHFPLSKSANIVTNFIGTVFLLSLLGGFLSDSYLGSFWTMLIFGFVELSVTEATHCNMVLDGDNCSEAKGYKALIFFLALYLVALGSGCLKPNIISHGADQFRKEDSKHPRSSPLTSMPPTSPSVWGSLLALTVLVWVQTHSGMGCRFRSLSCSHGYGLDQLDFRDAPWKPVARTALASSNVRNLLHTEKFRPASKFKMERRRVRARGDYALSHSSAPNVLGPTRKCHEHQTHKRLRNPSSFTSIHPYLMLIFLVPLYETVFVPIARKITGRDSGISPLQRIGIGLFVATLSMVSAALVEKKRRTSALDSNRILSIFWIAPQFSHLWPL
ncbi:Protein NRT1/ PTR family 4.4 [Vitis vinifera]|uniref:Protein NRT1/ PTR family 4.4 n=1 Tax=Vitis vinifera TaxID=29760 RepID=A0A438C9W0_VITVI|nr:Protein NRT1/ PTR family 4.4 [Vitis vinifera]